MENNNDKKTQLVEIRIEIYEALKKKQVEYSSKMGRIVPLVEVTTESIKKGIELI